MIGAIQSALNGLHAASIKVQNAAGNIAGNAPDTDLAGQAVDLSIAKTDYKANAIVMKAADEMQDSLLRIVDRHV